MFAIMEKSAINVQAFYRSFRVRDVFIWSVPYHSYLVRAVMRKESFCSTGKKGTSCHQKDVFVGLYFTNMPSFSCVRSIRNLGP